jgi:DNA-binding CsgD family transcriptional regulator
VTAAHDDDVELPVSASVPVPRDLLGCAVGDAVLLTFDLGVGIPRLPATLTTAQREVAVHALMGFDDEAIAGMTGRSVHTVSNLLRQVYRRVGVVSRFELAALAGASSD